ncbi:MAG TPA: serine/threonine-protein kinase [Polyangiales bacterium]|nr:serine/threonine-protein kinase [Polyangiales bacterium]
MVRKPSLQDPDGLDAPTIAAEDITEVFAQDVDGAPEEQVEETLSGGTAVGPYRVERLVGRGGGGAVYAARDRAGRLVAVKVLRAEMARFPSMITRFLREAEVVRQIAHPNIVEIYDIGEYEPNRPYYAMELLHGTDLRKLLQVHGRFTPSELLTILDPVCRAVGAAHEKGVVHRDIKANNILVVERDGERVVKLLDFGIAKMLHADTSGPGLTEPGAMLGTAHYMAPEQIRCEKPDGRTDIYALGVVIYQLLTGQHPFHADDPRQVALLHLQAPAPRPSALAPVPPAVDAIVLRCMEKKADKRFPDTAALLSALHAAIGEVNPSASEAMHGAVGIYVEARLEVDDDEAFEDVSNVIDSAQQELTAAGFSFPLQTATALLGVRLMVHPREAERAGAETTVDHLRAGLAARAGAHAGVMLSISCAVGEVQVRGETEIVGGSLLDIGSFSDPSRSGSA